MINKNQDSFLINTVNVQIIRNYKFLISMKFTIFCLGKFFKTSLLPVCKFQFIYQKSIKMTVFHGYCITDENLYFPSKTKLFLFFILTPALNFLLHVSCTPEIQYSASKFWNAVLILTNFFVTTIFLIKIHLMIIHLMITHLMSTMTVRKMMKVTEIYSMFFSVHFDLIHVHVLKCI